MHMPRNDGRPRMGEVSLRSMLAFAIAIGALVVMAQAPYIVSFMPQTAAVISSVLVELTNEDRAAQGLGTLTVSPVLTAVAQAKADDMAKNSYFAHVSPQGITPWHWFQEKGYQFSYAGENLAVDFSDSGQVVQAWMNSPTHRANIVGTQFTEIGIATKEGMLDGRPTTFVVQVFGTPAPKQETNAATVGTTTKPEVKKLAPRPVRDLPAPTTTPRTVALATTLPTTTPQVDVLGESAGAYLQTTQPPWWFKLVRYLTN